MLITYQSKLISKIQVSPEVYHLKFSRPEDPSWTYLAGQYMIFAVPQEGQPLPLKRLYSIASHPESTDSLDFLIEVVPGGVGSNYICGLTEGSETSLQGPAGMFTLKDSARDVIFLATGTGVAPMYSMANHLHTSGESLQTPDRTYHLLWGLKYHKDLYIAAELKALESSFSAFSYSICLSREEEELTDPSLAKGRVTVGLDAYLAQKQKQVQDFDYYICGGTQVVEGLRAHLEELGAPKEQVHFEKFS